MELQQYFRLFRRWIWLILILALIGGGVTFIIVAQRPPTYQASATVAIGQFIESPNPNSTDIRTGIDLAQTYAQLVETFDVLQGTQETLNLPSSPEGLRDRVSTRIITGTSLLVITVTYNDPVLAADIANTLADQLILQSPTNLTPEQETQVNFLNSQIDALNEQITEAREQLERLDTQIAAATTQSEVERLTALRITTLDQITQSQSTIAQFADTVTRIQQRTNSIDVVERARIPDTQAGTRIELNVLLGAMVGAMLAFGGVLLLEYLDDTIRSTEDATGLLALPVLGAIVRFGKKDDDYSKMLLTNFPSMSAIAEGYRTTRTNMLFSVDKERKGLFIITSPGPQEGKSITTANLAVTMAQAGLQVLLIDADLRRPKVHEIFQLENTVGLTTLLFSDPSTLPTEGNTPQRLPAAFEECVQQSNVPKLRILTSGFIPSNPTEILGSAVMARWLDLIRQSETIDVILIDTPPALAAADSGVLAANSGANVILVLNHSTTRRAAATRAKELFTQLGIKLGGLIINRINPRDDNYGYYYGYYYSAQQPSATRAQLPRAKAEKKL